MTRCTYLGHVVGSGGITPEESKIKTVMDFPMPRTKRQVCTFLELTGYYRRLIPDYVQILAPLTDLTPKTAPSNVQWTELCERAFCKLKELLCIQPVLRSPDFSKEFIVQTDASDRGIGAVLSQRDEDGTDRPIAYYSKKLLPREERYATIEKECLAIKLAVQAFRVYLLGRPFRIHTDHRALQWLDKLRESNARLLRWSLFLQSFQFVVEHRTGRDNANTDALSRID